jgi:hypothetical protein
MLDFGSRVLARCASSAMLNFMYYRNDNVTPIYTALMFRHLLAQGNAETCGICHVTAGYECASIPDPTTHEYVDVEECTCGKQGWVVCDDVAAG